MRTEAGCPMELWDVCDRDGNKSGRTKPRGDTPEEGEYFIGVSLWVVDHAGRLLIQKRAAGKRIHPGKWSITCGAVIAGETSLQGCLRETWEEIGLRLGENDVDLLFRSWGEHRIYDDFITLRDFPIEDAVLQAEEVSEIRWVTAQEMQALWESGQFMFDCAEALQKVEAYFQQNIGRTVGFQQESVR